MRGSVMLTAEVRHAPNVVTMRVATGQGWTSLGAVPMRASGVYRLDAWPDEVVGLASETHHGIVVMRRRLLDFCMAIQAAQPLVLE